MDKSVSHSGPGVEGAAAHDWATVWQSEIAALAVDRECQEAMHLAAATRAKLAPAPHDPAPGRASPDAAAGAAAAAAAPDARDAELARLRARLAELELAASRA